MVDLPVHNCVQEKFRINSASGKDISTELLYFVIAISRVDEEHIVGAGRGKRSTFYSSEASFLTSFVLGPRAVSIEITRSREEQK
jgi:hypothetical protein